MKLLAVICTSWMLWWYYAVIHTERKRSWSLLTLAGPPQALLSVGLFSTVRSCRMCPSWKTRKSLRAEDTKLSVLSASLQCICAMMLRWAWGQHVHQTGPAVSDKGQFALKEQHPPKLTPLTLRSVLREDVICSAVNSTLACLFFVIQLLSDIFVKPDNIKWVHQLPKHF